MKKRIYGVFLALVLAASCLFTVNMKTSAETAPEASTDAQSETAVTATGLPIITEDIFTGQAGQWDVVDYNAAHDMNEDVTTNLFATRSDERLYTLVTNVAGGLNTVNTYYISTGDDTGYSLPGYEKIDYVVKEAKLFKVIADNTLSEAMDDVWMSYYNNHIEMQLYLEQIGNPDTIKINWRGCSGSLTIPSDGSLMEVSARFEMERLEDFYYPKEEFASFGNPYKGWAIWGLPDETIADYDAGLYHFESNLIYIALTWKDLQPDNENQFNLEEHLEKFNIDEWVARGKRINLRFMMDNTDYVYAEYASKEGTLWDWSTWNQLKEDYEANPTNAEAEAALQEYYETYLKFERMDIPMWLYEELVEFDKSQGGDGSGAGIFYWDRTGDELGIGYDQAGFAPNYYSEKLIQRHDEIIAKIAEYWDNNSITGHVMIGSLGHWGEFHVWPEGSGIWPDVETLERYIQSYIDHFKNVKLGIRKPYPIAADNNLGLFNDIFGVDTWGASGTPAFYGYFMEGNTDFGSATDYQGNNLTGVAMNGKPAQALWPQVQASKMPEFWKYNWSGGEFADGQIRAHMTNETATSGIRGTMGVLDEIRYCHVSWMGPCSPSNYLNNEIDAVMHDSNVLAAQKLMGYNFALEKISKVDVLQAEQEVPISMVWNNQGVAPFYYEWPLELSLIDAEGNVAYKQKVNIEDANITEWLPGRHEVATSFTVPDSVKNGEYTLAVAILDKDSLEPGIRLLIEAVREDLRHPLYTVSVEGGAMTVGSILIVIAFLVVALGTVLACGYLWVKKKRAVAIVLAVGMALVLVGVGTVLVNDGGEVGTSENVGEFADGEKSEKSGEFEETVAVENASATGVDNFAESGSVIISGLTEDAPTGKDKVEFYGITVESKKYNGAAVKLDMSRFLCSEVSIMDYTQLDYVVEVVNGGVDEDGAFVFAPGNLCYGALPKQPGNYRLTISIPEDNEEFWGEEVIEFTIYE